MNERDSRDWLVALFAINVVRIASWLAIQGAWTVLAWQVFVVRESVWDIGVLAMVRLLPSLILLWWGGTLGDSYDRRVVAGAGLAVVAGALVTMGIAGSEPHVAVPFVIAALISIGRAISGPSLIAMFGAEVRAREATRQIAIATFGMRIAGFAGPVSAGVVFAESASVAYLLLAAVMVCSIVTLPLIRRRPVASPIVQPAIPYASLEGPIRAAALIGLPEVETTATGLRPDIRAVLALELFAILFASSLGILPMLVHELDLGADTLGFLRGAPSLGALVASILVISSGKELTSGKWVLGSTFAYSLVVIAIGWGQSVAVLGVILAVVGAFEFLSSTARQQVIHRLSTEAVRTRIASIYQTIVVVAYQLGDLQSAALAAVLGAAKAIAAGGALSGVAVCVVGIRTGLASLDLRREGR